MRGITGVLGVETHDLGTPEALWRICVKDFSSHRHHGRDGNSLPVGVEKGSAVNLAKLAEPVF